jgi:hypothetical protein
MSIKNSCDDDDGWMIKNNNALKCLWNLNLKKKRKTV